jgi:hypothetical protein
MQGRSYRLHSDSHSPLLELEGLCKVKPSLYVLFRVSNVFSLLIRYHVGYPTFVRISGGIYGSLLFIFIRGVSLAFHAQIKRILNGCVYRSWQFYTWPSRLFTPVNLWL